MPVCPWCDKETSLLLKHVMPDNDYIEVCGECYYKEHADYLLNQTNVPTKGDCAERTS